TPELTTALPHIFNYPPHALGQLRDDESQEALAELSRCPSLSLAASVDHVNAALLWDVRLVNKFNWAWHKTTTYAHYTEEVGLLFSLSLS
ncbi:unnamed protein product, partial [Discosporangium mesarthrocarpum]